MVHFNLTDSSWSEGMYWRTGVRSLSRLYEASESVDRLEFGNFVEYRNLEDEFPGMIYNGFIKRIFRKSV